MLDCTLWASHWVVIEKAGLVCNGSVVSGFSYGVSLVLFDGVVRLLGVANFFAVSFGRRKPCCFFSGLGGSVNHVKLLLVVTEATSLSLAGFSPVKVLSKRHTWVNPSENFWKDTSTIDTIESLFIIQRTQPKPSNTTPSDITNNIIAFEHQVTGLLFNSTAEIITCIILQRTSTDNTKPKISSLLGTPVNTESARETFYRELIQNTNLYPITYTSKSKGKLQTPVVTPKKIQPPTWKKTKIKSPTNPSYYYTPGSAINISSTDTKTELLGPYGEYFERFNLQSSISLGLRSPLPSPDFGISDLWEATESEKEEEESENQEFTYQHPITENPEQPLQLPLQQPGQQQLLQQPPQPPNLDPMVYTPIAKLDNFMGEEDDAQVWLNDVEKAISANGWNDARAIQAIPYFFKDTANSWYQSLVNKPQDFNAFKVEFLRYFSNNNSINRLVNAFTTIKQEETEAVTTYLGCFYQNLCQIQAIDANYFTASQILN
ncbi:hypothetical protein G9A89_022293 [Geosiphon pyriformis]|nr:hypothetical protein G9A89_022293 [Geosiphon pyriformis]